MSEVVHFYQTGTFTVGNRLVTPEERAGQASMERTNALTSGHRACQGCGEALGARYAVDAAMRAVNGRLAAANATGCLEVFSTPYPETSWQLPWFHSLFGNTAAVGRHASRRPHGDDPGRGRRTRQRLGPGQGRAAHRNGARHSLRRDGDRGRSSRS